MDRLLENKLIALDLPEWCTVISNMSLVWRITLIISAGTELVRNLLSQNPEGRPSMANVHSVFK